MDIAQLVLDPLQILGKRLAVLLPRALGALLIVVVGLAVAYVLRHLMIRVLQAMRVDRLAEKAKLSEALRRGAIRLSFAECLGQVGYWLVMAAAIIVALQFLGMAAATEWLERFGYFIPRLVISIVILLLGTLIASFLSVTVRAASLNAGFPQGHVLGQVIYAIVVLLTVIMALEQLQVVTRTIEVALYIFMGACGLAFALALGLGSQEFVRQFLNDLRDQWKSSSRP